MPHHIPVKERGKNAEDRGDDHGGNAMRSRPPRMDLVFNDLSQGRQYYCNGESSEPERPPIANGLHYGGVTTRVKGADHGLCRCSPRHGMESLARCGDRKYWNAKQDAEQRRLPIPQGNSPRARVTISSCLRRARVVRGMLHTFAEYSHKATASTLTTCESGPRIRLVNGFTQL